MKKIFAMILLSTVLFSDTVTKDSEIVVPGYGKMAFLCINGYKWIATKTSAGIDLHQPFIEKQVGAFKASVPEKCEVNK